MNTVKQVVIIWCVIAFSISACSGGGSSSQATGTNANPANANNNAGAGWGLLINAGESNTIGLQLTSSDDGSVHANYADIAGRVFYARCESTSNCAQGSGWQSTVIGQLDIGLNGYAVPRLELTDQSQPRIATYSATSAFGNGTVHYATCDNACTTATSWVAGEVLQFGDSVLKAKATGTDWFALDSSNRPVISLFLTAGLLDSNAAVRLFSCNNECINASAWQQQIISTYAFSSAGAVSININEANQYNLSLHVKGITSNIATVTWFGCSSNCLNGGVWSNGVELQTVEQDINSTPQMAMTVSGQNQPFVLSYNDADTTSLTLHSCVANCSQSASWIQRSMDEKINLNATVFDIGYGVDAHFDGASVEVVFAAKEAGSGLRELLVAATCERDCTSTAASWTSRLVANTQGDLEDPVGCVFIGTGIISSVSATRKAVGFTANPQWACGGQVVELTNQFGEISYDYSGDIRFLEMAAVAVY